MLRIQYILIQLIVPTRKMKVRMKSVQLRTIVTILFRILSPNSGFVFYVLVHINMIHILFTY